MDLVAFGPDDDAAVAAYVALRAAAATLDEPWEAPRSAYRQAMSQRYGHDGELSRFFLVRDANVIVAVAEVFASDYDNTDQAWIEVVVHPDLRRRGHGRMALELVHEECRKIGRRLVLIGGWETPATRAFAEATGYGVKLAEVRRTLHLEGSPEQLERIRGLHADAVAHAGEYELLTFAGTTPDELLPGLVEVVESINDAPLDDLEYEDEIHDVERIRAYERAQALSGYRLYRVVARSRTTGELAGHTAIAVDADQPTWSEQHDTAVVPAHRGHRLGMLLKSAMLLHLADVEPQIRTMITYNAASNGPMIAVNEALGMRVVGHNLLLQRRLD